MNEMEIENFANLYQQEHAVIYGRNVWHWLVDTSIGQIHISTFAFISSKVTPSTD